MIKLDNVTKKYNNNNKQDKTAIDSVSISFPKKGLVFITGDSGSGKTTLLNLISGLDQPTSGTISFRTEDINSLKYDIDRYRRELISIVFQDYNLLENFSIKDNIKLSANIQSKLTTDAEIIQILSRLGIEDTYDKFPNELSGGEQQRVAIARSLIRKTDVLIADEPTGNLDSKTSESFYKLLELLSKDILVIVVTHNLKFAKKYGDEILKLQDGIVIKTLHNSVIISSEKQKLNEKEKDITKSNKLLLMYRIALNNIKSTKMKNLFSIILTTISITLLGIVISMGDYNINIASKQTFDMVDAEVIPYGLCAEYLEDTYVCSRNQISPLEMKKYNELISNSSNTLSVNLDIPLDATFNRISNKELLIDEDDWFTPYKIDGLILSGEDPNFDFHEGFLSEAADSIVLTDYIFDHLFPNYEYSDVINSNIQLLIFDEIYSVSGVIKTNYLDYYELSNRITNPSHLKYHEHEKIYKEFSSVQESFYTRLIVNETSYSKIISNKDLEYQIYINDEIRDIYSSSEVIGSYLLYSTKSFLEKDEVFVDLETFNLIYNTDFTSSQIKNNLLDLSEYADEIELELQVNDTHNFKQSFALVNVKIVGIYYNESAFSNEVQPTITFYENDFYDILTDSTNIDYILHIYDKINQNNISVFQDFEEDFNHFHYYSESLYSFDYQVDRLSNVISITSIVLIVFTTILIGYIIMNLIVDKRKEIGILRALGMNKQDVFKVYAFQTSLITIPSIVISSILLFFSVLFLNGYVAPSIGMIIPIATLDYKPFIAILLTISLVNVLSLIMPFIKYNRLKPTEIIYNRGN